MMQAFDGGVGGQAVLEYLDGEFRVVRPGAFVICAVTGAHIPLDALRYWNVERQEAYVDGEAALKAHRAHEQGA